MAIERTLSIIKPDAAAKNVIGKIYSRFETNGLKIVASKMAWLSPQEAGAFYAVHRERLKELVEFMTSGPVMIQVLEGESAIAKNRVDGGDRPGQSCAGDDSCRFLNVDRCQCCTWIGWPRYSQG